MLPVTPQLESKAKFMACAATLWHVCQQKLIHGLFKYASDNVPFVNGLDMVAHPSIHNVCVLLRFPNYGLRREALDRVHKIVGQVGNSSASRDWVVIATYVLRWL